MAAIKTLNAGKPPDSDHLHPEFFLHLDEKCLKWLRILFKEVSKSVENGESNSCTQAKQTS